MSREKFLPLVQQSAQQHGVPPAVLAGLIEAESNWNPSAKNPTSSAHGLGQFIKATAKDMGVNTSDPASSIDGAARYLKQLHQRFGDWNLAVQGYHDGPGGVSARLKGKGGTQSRESAEYLGRVMGAAKKFGDVPAQTPALARMRGEPPSLLAPVQLAAAPAEPADLGPVEVAPAEAAPETLQRPRRSGHQLAALVESALGDGALKSNGMPAGLSRLIDRLIDA